VEPIAALFDWPDDEYGEVDFLTELLERDGRYPPASDLRAELDAIAAAAGVPSIT
jgi:uncharacterized protein (UPF0276 family)